MPAGYRVEYGGQFESQQSASRRLAVLFIGVVAGLFMLLVLAFGRARDAVIVMVNLLALKPTRSTMAKAAFALRPST